MKRDLGKYIVNGIYIVLWLTPIYFFAKDFFEISSLEILKERYLKEVVMFSIKQGLYSTIIALLIGLIPAYYTAYRKDSISKLIQGLVFIPFFFPVISIVTIFSIIFNLPLIKELNILYTLKGIIVANVFYNSPIFVKYISEGLKKIPKELEEAMRIDGAGAFIIFFKGQLPIILPQIFRTFILVFTYCFLGLGIILSLGGIKYSNIEVEIANTLMGGADFSKAMILGGIQFIILLALNFLGLFIKEYEIYGEQEEKNLNPLFKIYSLIYMLFQYGVIILTFLLSFVNQYTGKFSIKAYYNLFSHEFNENYEIDDAQAITEKMARLMELRSDVFKALEEARAEKKIGKSLEATVYMHVSADDQKIINEVLGCKLAQWLIVSEAILTDTTMKKYDHCEVSVEKCQGKVCPRCWNMHDESDAHECCNRCVDVLKKEYPQVPIL